jgi:enolase
MAKIKEISAREILNATGDPTIETTVVLSDGSTGVATAPSGVSSGSYEAVELRDKDEKRFAGQGVLKAVENVTKTIAEKLVGQEANKQADLDRMMIELDGTQNKARLGANATISVSMALAKAAAKSSVLPLYLYLRDFLRKEKASLRIPIPMFNLINGGKHAGGNLDLQEFLLVPASSKSYTECLEMGVSVYKQLDSILKENGYGDLTGIEGGYAPSLNSNEDALSFMSKAVNAANFRLGYDAFLGIDAASNYFYHEQHYRLKDRSMAMTADDLINYYSNLLKAYHVLYLEDPLSEDDWDGWAKLGPKMDSATTIAGDNLVSTNPYRLQMALDHKAMNAVVIKPNQIGTVIEAMAVVEVARVAGLKIIVSQRSGETNDDFIADFAVAVSADYVKFGAPSREEHVVKYNRLLELEKQLKIL